MNPSWLVSIAAACAGSSIGALLYYWSKAIIPQTIRLAIRRAHVSASIHKYRDTWPIDPSSAHPPIGWSGWPDDKQFAVVLTHDVETAKGVQNCNKLKDLESKIGFRSSFNFVAEGYRLEPEYRDNLTASGFEIGLHGLKHNGNMFRSEKVFFRRLARINLVLEKWQAVGFRCPSMYHNMELIHHLNIEYDCSTFDTDPFEPQPDGVGTVFPFLVEKIGSNGYVELPYTLPQDHLLFILMKEQNIDIWKRKLDWIAANGGMVLLNTHPDYMNFGENPLTATEYPSALYVDFLNYLQNQYKGQYWLALPKEMARFWRTFALSKNRGTDTIGKK